MIRSLAAGAAAFAVFVSALPTLAQPGMGLIGRRQITSAADRDTITVSKTENYGTLMLCVDDAPVHLMEMVVHYRNGTSQNIRLRSVVQAGRCGREIELHNRREIASVDLTYNATRLGEARASVLLFGR
jgi:hypothetical protein